MKKINKLVGLFMCLLIIFVCCSDLIYALNQRQIIEDGGENSYNTENKQDGVTVSKTIASTDIENFFDITLTVETSSNVQSLVTEPDVAIVIVMDLSNTMVVRNTNDTGNVKRLAAAQDAAEALIDEFYGEAAKAPNSERKIGFVSFNSHAQEIFPLLDWKTKTATELKDEMNNKTNEIVDTYDYGTTEYYADRWTNIEAGLKRAKDMLATSSIDNQNKYIILLSDGMPTTYLKDNTSDDYIGYNPYMYSKYNPDFSSITNKTASVDGTFYNEITGVLCTAAVDYSDRGAIRAREMAESIKALGIDIYSVGIGLKDTSVETVVTNTDLIDVDKETYIANSSKYEVETAGAENFKSWLQNSIGSGYYYDTNTLEALKLAFLNIFALIKQELATSTEGSWVANDPMGMAGNVENIEFVGFYDDDSPKKLHNSLNDYTSENVDITTQSDTATFNTENSTINWDLKKSSYTTTVKNNVTYYKYDIVYRVRLENELDSFIEGNEYDTNEETFLTYVVREHNETTGEDVLSDNKKIRFPIPSVQGYLGDFEFVKKSSYGNRTLEGVEFRLEHRDDCSCHDGYIANMEDKNVIFELDSVISDKDGNVRFTDIPSGHQYNLIEVAETVPKDHSVSDNSVIRVDYGVVTGQPGDEGLINVIDTGNLVIKKEVNGNDEYSGTFKFLLEIDFDNTDLIGVYSYKIYDASDSVIESGKIGYASTEIELKKDYTYEIYDLPVGATYMLKEITTNGYDVEYSINDSELISGDTAVCNLQSDLGSCRIESGDSNDVLFVNTASYILPATGSSGMLILIIIGSLLLGLPVINICYALYKTRREDKLAS